MSLISNVLGGAGAIGKSFLRKKWGIAANLLAGFGGSIALSEMAAKQRNLYGDEEYQARYHGAIETGAAILPYVGVAGAIGRWTGKDIFGLSARTYNTGANIVKKGARSVGFIKSAKLSKNTLTAGDFLMAGAGTAASMVPFNLTTAGIVAGVNALGAYAMAGRAFGFMGATATVAAGVGMGYAGTRMAHYPAGEGNITDFRVANPNMVRKMDFNTSGLVQALHMNRKVM